MEGEDILIEGEGWVVIEDGECVVLLEKGGSR
jgi:uncharacterized membrane protein